MRTAADDEEEEFGRCFDECWLPVVRYLMRRGAVSCAEDLAAETFAIAWSKWKQVPSTPLPWLLKTAGFRWANERRRIQRADDLNQFLRPVLTDDPAYERHIAGADSKAVLTVIAELGVDEREALLLTSWDELSSKDAAYVVGCSISALRVRVHRARKKLKQALTDAGHMEPVNGGQLLTGQEH